MVTQCKDKVNLKIFYIMLFVNELEGVVQNYEGNLFGEAWRNLCKGDGYT